MTREEAINILTYHKSNVPENSLITNALDMAVKALEQTDCGVCKYLVTDEVFDEETGEEIDASYCDKPCEDAISRADAIKAMSDLEQEDEEMYGCPIPEGFDGKRAIETLQSLPPVTPKQKMGHWIWQTEDIYRCSECGEDIHVKEVMNVPQYEFCPMCGAKMV